MTNVIIVLCVLQLILTIWAYADNIKGLRHKKPYADPTWFIITFIFPFLGIFAYFQLKQRGIGFSSIFAKEREQDHTYTKYYAFIIGLGIAAFVLGNLIKVLHWQLPWDSSLAWSVGCFLIGLGVALFILRKEQQLQK